MKIEVHRRFYFESILGTPQEDSVLSRNNVISINSCYHEEPPFSEKNLKRDNLLILYFDDVIPLNGNILPQMFSDKQADEIINFIKRIDCSMPMIIHCTAGIARSAAVGEELNGYMNRFLENNPTDFEYFYSTNRDIMPDKHVGKTLRQKLLSLKL
jgi:predicted protein tyrosine phosphatase